MEFLDDRRDMGDEEVVPIVKKMFQDTVEIGRLDLSAFVFVFRRERVRDGVPDLVCQPYTTISNRAS